MTALPEAPLVAGLCPGSGTVIPAREVSGDWLLHGPCPSRCGRRWLAVEPVVADDTDGLWFVKVHRCTHRLITSAGDPPHQKSVCAACHTTTLAESRDPHEAERHSLEDEATKHEADL